MTLKEKQKKIDLAFEDLEDKRFKKSYEEVNEVIYKLYIKSSQINYQKGINTYYEKLINILFFTSQNYLAISSLQHLIDIYLKNEKKNILKLSRLYVVFGVVLTRLSDYKSSSFYLNKALEINIASLPESIHKLGVTYQCLAFNESQQKKFRSAINFLDLGLDILNEENKDKKVNIELAKIHIFLELNKIQKATALFEELSKNNNSNNIIIKNSITEIKIRLNLINGVDSGVFLELINSTLKSSIETSDPELTMRLLEIMTSYYKKEGDFKMAFEYSSKINQIKKDEATKNVSIINVAELNPLINIKQSNTVGKFEVYSFEELEKASLYQENFYRNRLQSSKINARILFKPAKKLSGNYVGTFSLCNNDNYYLLVLADVVGKGIIASYISFMLDGIIKSIIFNADSFQLTSIVKDINKILSDSLKNQGFLSLWVGIVDIREQKLESVNAGHLPTYVLKGDKTIELSKGCTILGMFDNLSSIESEFIEFKKGDSIIAYSNGVTEATDEKDVPFKEKFLKLITEYKQNKNLNFIKYLENDIRDHQNDLTFKDDISCLLVEFNK